MRKRTVRGAAGALALAALLAGCSAESITQAQATEIALEHAGVTQEEASSLSVQQDTTEEGRKVYEIDFSTQDTEYHYDVARNNGEIINYHYDTASAASSGEAQGDDGQESGTTAQEATSAPSQSSQSGAAITEDEATSIALEHAGVTAEEATVYRVKADYEDGRAVYDVEFAVGATEYDYEIAQEDGAVLSYDSDVEGWTPVLGENQTSSQGAGPVSQEEATQLVLDRVPGAAESDVRIRLDRDDGREVYEGEVYYDRTEYEFEIDASTGSFLEWSADSGR